MLQTLNCIRMGEVLFDENLQLFILCNNCHTDLRTSQDFRQHLEKCEGLENLFQQGRRQFKYNSDKCTQLFGKTIKGIKEFLIYDYDDVEVTCSTPEDSFIDLINIEEELSDPKWYSDLNVDASNTTTQKSSKKYDELVEAVTPFVQFKENVKNNNNNSSHSIKTKLVKPGTVVQSNVKIAQKSPKKVQFDLTPNKVQPTAKRKLSTSKIVPVNCSNQKIPAETGVVTNNTLLYTTPISQVTKTYASKKRKLEPTTANGFIKESEVNPITTINTISKNTTMPPPKTITTNILLNSAPRKPAITPITITKQEPIKEKQTAQILNKLQNLGLQVKRTQPIPQPAAANPLPNSKTDTKTLEILQKLQSKGMKVKILNKQQTDKTNVNFSLAKSLQGSVPNPAQNSINVIRNSAPNMTFKQNLNKNLIIKKVN